MTYQRRFSLFRSFDSYYFFLQVVQLSIAIQNASMIGAAFGVILLLLETVPQGPAFISLVFMVNFLGGVQALAGLANNIAVERDW